MEDFIGLIVLAVIYILSASSKKNKKAKRRRRDIRKEELERAIAADAQSKENSRRGAAEPSERRREVPDARLTSDAKAELCENDRLHLHHPTQEQMQQAAEGEDPCHKGGERSTSTPDNGGAYAQAGREIPEEAAQEVLRGVIMSEILLRPQQRRAIQNNRWRA